MAAPIGYTPPPAPDTGAQDDLDELVAALHDSGLLRALAGAVRAYPQLLTMLMEGIDARTIRSLISLASIVDGLDPDQTERLAKGLRQARVDATEAASGEPEGIRGLAKRMRDPDVRRGISAALAGLAAVGGAFKDEPRH